MLFGLFPLEEVSAQTQLSTYTAGSILVGTCGCNQKYYSACVFYGVWYLFSAVRFLPGGSGR